MPSTKCFTTMQKRFPNTLGRDNDLTKRSHWPRMKTLAGSGKNSCAATTTQRPRAVARASRPCLPSAIRNSKSNIENPPRRYPDTRTLLHQPTPPGYRNFGSLPASGQDISP